MYLVRAILSIYSRKLTNKFDKIISNKTPKMFYSYQGGRCKPPKYATVYEQCQTSVDKLKSVFHTLLLNNINAK